MSLSKAIYAAVCLPAVVSGKSMPEQFECVDRAKGLLRVEIMAAYFWDHGIFLGQMPVRCASVRPSIDDAINCSINQSIHTHIRIRIRLQASCSSRA
jgi:hypothetical protein